MNKKKSGKFTADDLPQKEAFVKKEVYQHPQPADSGKTLNKDDKNDRKPNQEKEMNRTAKEEGLNEKESKGSAGAFEGYEDQEKR